MSDYYKSLITDDEVIKELIRESKRREGRLPTEATRLKPNLNFFQRTVNNLISNNTRIDKSKDSFKTEYLKDCNVKKPNKSDDTSYYASNEATLDYAFERELSLQRKLKAFSSRLPGLKKTIEIKKINFIAASKSNGSDNIVNKGRTNQNVCEILSDSDEEESTNDFDVMLSDGKRKITCNTYFTKDKESKFIEESKESISESKEDIILISSDDGSIEMISDDSKDGDIKTQVKTSGKKKKKKKLAGKLNNESESKAKRKKHKKKKKRKAEKS